MAEYMLPSGGVVSDPGDGLELMLPDGGVLNQQTAAPAGGNRRRRVLMGAMAMTYARQSTAIIVTVGPTLDADGVAVTGGVVADYKISKNGGAPAALNASATYTHRHTGYGSLSLTASDVDTVGTVEITMDDTVNACPMKEIQVLEPVVYDALFADAATGMLPANLIQWLGVAPLALSSQQVQAVVPNTQKVDVETIKTNPVVNGGTITFPTNATVASTTNITAGTITTTTNLTNLPAITANWLTAAGTAADFGAEIADAVWDEDATGHQTGGTFGQAIGDPGADTTTIYQSVVTDAAGTNIAVDIAAIEAQTDDIGVAGAGLTAIPWNASWDAEVQSEVDDALVAQRLDELLNADSDIDGAAPPTVGSVFHELLSATAGSFTFDQTTDSLEALRNRGDAAWTTATSVTVSDKTGFSLASTGLDLVVSWTTAITGNITGNLSGNVGGSVGSVLGGINTTAGVITTLDALDTAQDAQHATTQAKTNLLPEGPSKNTQFTYVIKMVDSTDHVTPKTGLTVTMTRSLDGAAFGAATGTVTEISTGHYKVVASAADMNGDIVAHRLIATGADDFTMTFLTTV